MFAVDVGNTRLKICRFEPLYLSVNGCCLAEPAAFYFNAPGDITRLQASDWMTKDWLTNEEPQDWFIAQTGKFPWEECQNKIAALRPKDRFRFLSYKDIPLEIDVEHPERVGLDRLLAVYAASLWRKEHEKRFPEGMPVVIADAGSALTVDLLTKDGHFGGGIIFPGLHSLAKALSEISPKLPLVELHSHLDRNFPAKNTEDACLAGIVRGTVGAVSEFYRAAQMQLRCKKNSYFPILLTGGDGNIIYKGLVPNYMMKEFVFYRPNLVLEGIAAVAEKCKISGNI